MRTLDRKPGVELSRAELLLFRRMPADGRGIKKNIRAAQARETRAFRIPLVPADQSADPAVPRVEIGKAQITRSEIELLVVERIVRDVHLAVKPEQRTVGVEHGGGVVMKPGGAALEDRRDDDHPQLACELAERFRGGAGNRFGQIEALGIFFAAKILSTKQLLEANDLNAAPGRFADALDGAREICGGVGGAFPLQQPDGQRLDHESNTTIPLLNLRQKSLLMCF